MVVRKHFWTVTTPIWQRQTIDLKSEVDSGSEILKIKVTTPPVEGKANEVLIQVLAEYFNVKKSAIRIIKGEKSREKIVMIEEI